MKKHRCLLILTALFALFLLGGASAEMLNVEVDLPYPTQWTYMLRCGDTLHCLTISKEIENPKDLSEITVHVAAQCSALEDGALVPCQNHCADRFEDRVFHPVSREVIPTKAVFGMPISSRNQTYMIDGDWAVYQWTPDAAEPWLYLCTLDTSRFDFDSYVTEVTFTTDGDALYGCFLEREGDDETKGTVFTFSLASGACEVIPLKPDVLRVYPVDERRLLYEGNSSIRTPFGYVSLSCYYLYDRATGRETKLTRSAYWALAADGQGGWYGVDLGDTIKLTRLDADGNEGEPNPLLMSRFIDMGTTVSLSEDQTTVYVSGASGALIVAPLPGAEGGEAPPALVLAGSLNEYGMLDVLPDMAEFSAANQGAQIKTVDYPATFDDLALELVSGSDRFDLMVLELSAGNVDSLLDKGYYVDLSDDDGIAAYVQNLYPTWRNECLRGEEIVGIPINVRNVWTFMVNLDVWEEEGLEALPKTYDELFDCIEDWDSLGILDEVPLFQNRYTPFYDRLFNRIMVDYMGHCKREGKPIVFTDETLLRLLGRLEDVRAILEANYARNISGDGLLFEGVMSDIVHVKVFNGFEVAAENNAFAPLPLGLTDAEDCVEPVFFTMLVVNPNSRRQALARAYLAYLAEHPTTWAQCHLFEDGPVGVREKGYEDLDEQYEQRLSELNEKIAAALQEGDEAVAGRWEQEKQALIDDYLNMWEVRPGMAELLYQMMPYFTPLTSDGYGFLETSCDDLTAMFLEGRMDARAYTMRLDERMRMAELEGIR